MRILPRSPFSKSLIFATGGKRRKSKASARLKNSRPWLEALEDRWVPTVLTVNNFKDGLVDLNNSIVTLRDAIYASTNHLQVSPGGPVATGTDEIKIKFSVTGPKTITLTQGELDIASNLTITGPGPDKLTVDANDLSRVFNIDDGTSTALQVSVTGLTISGGIVPDSSDPTRERDGGGISNVEDLTVQNCTVRDNTDSAFGNYGMMTIEDSTINNNSSLVENETSTSGTTGIGDNYGTLFIRDSMISGNSGASGLVNHGSLSIFNSTLTGNRSGLGSTIINSATLLLENSILSGNSAIVGGALEMAALESGPTPTSTVQNCTLSNNYSELDGGAIYIQSDSPGLPELLTLQNSTLSGNTAVRYGGSIYGQGTIAVQGCTITQNHAAIGGGIFSLTDNSITLQNSIVAQNFSSYAFLNDSPAPDDIQGGSIKPGSQNNLIGIGGSGGLANGVNGNLVGIADPGLAALANNGGPTPTHALLPSSPAINAGSAAFGGATDQRGLPRVNATDIGSFEFQTPLETPSLVVTTLADVVSRIDNQTSLREAITYAASLPGVDTISFRAGLTGTITLTQGELDITSSLTITGPGADKLTVDANQASRVFNIDDGTSTDLQVSLTGLTIRGGQLIGNAKGGGILNEEDLTVQNCTVRDNSGASTATGIGIYNSGIVTILDSTISSNLGGGAAVLNDHGNATMRDTMVSEHADAIYVVFNDGTFLIQDCDISGNNEVFYLVLNQSNATMTIEGSTIKNNSGQLLFQNIGTLTMRDSTISGNSAFGAITNVGTLLLQSCIVSGNSGVNGAAISTSSLSGTATVQGCTLSNNTTTGNGGAVYVNGGSIELQNCTLSENTAGGEGGAIFVASNGKATVQNCTITQNHATNGGGIFSSTANSITLQNTIVAQNFRNTPATTADDIMGSSIKPSSQNNLIGIGGSGGLANGVNGNLVGIANPGLGALADNGGPTLTVAILPGSPAIDAGSNSLVPEGVTTDQPRRRLRAHPSRYGRSRRLRVPAAVHHSRAVGRSSVRRRPVHRKRQLVVRLARELPHCVRARDYLGRHADRHRRRHGYARGIGGRQCGPGRPVVHGRQGFAHHHGFDLQQGL